MNLSNTSKYAIRALSFMALSDKEIVSASAIIDELQTSDKYTRSLMTKLVKAGLVTAVRGRSGGYRFRKTPDRIYLKDIVNAVEDISKYFVCILGHDDCKQENLCELHEEWSKIRKSLQEFFENTNLAKLHDIA
ncbi:MAG: Rrf2 family transcriptional regulator [Bacteroidota bacterium]